jgi:hypothetical protein
MHKLFLALCLFSTFATGATAQLLECKSEDATAYVEIKTPWFGSPTIIVRIWGSAIEFPVDVMNTTHYHAREKTSQLSRLSLHRVTGALNWQFDTVKEDLPILVDLCDKRITPSQCIKRATRMETSNACAVTDLQVACDRWRVGMTLVRNWDFTCTPTAPKF